MASADPGKPPHLSSSGAGLPVAPSLESVLASADIPSEPALVDRRVLFVAAVSTVVGLSSGFVAKGLVDLIALVTNLAFYGRLSVQQASPAQSALGYWVLLVPPVGGLVVGLMARYGSRAIRGHGIPEAMEQVLENESRIPPRVLFLKPVSAAVSIGTGGPFGAEGPIISTGGALGSLVGQLLETTAQERKTLLAAGAAAGMTAIFGTPVSAVLLAVELLLFELRPRSIIPVALASVGAMGVRLSLFGSGPAFPMGEVSQPGGGALVGYVLVGALVGGLAVAVTKLVYAVEDAFERLPIHWMWWPALGAAAVGAAGLVSPRTLGVGYDNIESILSGALAGRALFWLAFWKLVSWSVSLGSGTSGGTLAPLFTIGGGFGALAGETLARLLPAAGIDPRLAGLVGMAAVFAGASRALLASVVFAFETTRQPIGLLPLLGGGAAAYLISCLLMRNTIMTEKIARRGVRVPSEYSADHLDSVLVGRVASRTVVSLKGEMTVGEARRWMSSGAADAQFQGYPVLDADGRFHGLVGRRELFRAAHGPGVLLLEIARRPAAVLFEDSTLREARDLMARHRMGRLPVVTRREPRELLGIVSRSDILSAHLRPLAELHIARKSIVLRGPGQKPRGAS